MLHDHHSYSTLTFLPFHQGNHRKETIDVPSFSFLSHCFPIFCCYTFIIRIMVPLVYEILSTFLLPTDIIPVIILPLTVIVFSLCSLYIFFFIKIHLPTPYHSYLLYTLKTKLLTPCLLSVFLQLINFHCCYPTKYLPIYQLC